MQVIHGESILFFNDFKKMEYPKWPQTVIKTIFVPGGRYFLDDKGTDFALALSEVKMYREYDENKIIRQFEILRDIAVLSMESEKISSVAKEALQATGKLINLSAATLMMWDDQSQPTMNISFADSAV